MQERMRKALHAWMRNETCFTHGPSEGQKSNQEPVPKDKCFINQYIVLTIWLQLDFCQGILGEF